MKILKKNFIDCLLMFLFIMLTLHYIILYYVKANLISNIYLYPVMLINIFLIILYIFLYRSRKKIKNTYEKSYLIIFFIILFNSIIRLLFSIDLMEDVALIILYLSIFNAYLYKNLDILFFEKLFKILTIIAFFGIIFAFLRIKNFDINYAMRRGYQYKEIFYYAVICWGASPFVILSVLKNKNIFLSFLYLGLNLFAHIIIVKRMVFYECFVLLIILILMIFICKIPKIKLVCLFIVSILLLMLLSTKFDFKYLVMNILERIGESAEDLQSFDRNIELKNFLLNEKYFNLLLGKGFQGSQIGLGTVQKLLHNGWGNLILKGGIPMFLLFLIPFIKVILNLKKIKKQPIKKQFCSFYVIYGFFMFFLANFQSYDPRLFLLSYCCLGVMEKEKYLKG